MPATIPERQVPERQVTERQVTERRVPERRVVEIWQSAIRQRTDLHTAGGPVKILYPGRPNDGRGADIKDAVISTRQGIYKGDIEIHVKSGDWKAHGHEADPAYNQVILHVVYQNGAGGQARLRNGLDLPALPLDGFAEEQAGQRITSVFSPEGTARCNTGLESITATLQKAGEARFQSKIREYEENILQSGAGQALYSGIMTALGYSKNKTPMARLAAAVPLQELEDIMSAEEDEITCLRHLQARLLGGAGLLPSQRPAKSLPESPAANPMREIEQIWISSGRIAEMSGTEWEFFKVRPGNYPDRRLTAMAALLIFTRQPGLLAALETITCKTEEDGGRSLEEAFAGKGRGFEANDAVSGLPAPVGKERAGVIMINVLLPFFAAYARGAGKGGLEKAVRRIYSRYPAGTENSVEKHMRKQLGIAAKQAATALRRQGLLHLYQAFCTQGRCGECLLGGNPA